MPLKLFKELLIGSLFHHGDNPKRLLIKQDETHYVAPEGRRSIHPHVAVVEKQMKTQPGGTSIYEKFTQKKGDSDE